MIRRDNYFIFDKIVGENVNKWINHRQYRYKNMIFSNYIYFILHYCIENDSDNCRQIMMKELSKRDLSKNLHKKNVVRYIKWTS
jgi:hypothetical protein